MKGCLLALFLFISLPGSDITSPEISAREIVNKMLLNYYYANDDLHSHVYMEIVSPRGEKRIREFVIMRKDLEDGRQLYYTYFYKPSDVQGVVFMVHKNVDRDDDRWLYLPAIDLVRRISANDKHSSFVGSHFTYEDVSGRHLDEDEYQLLGQESFKDKPCYLIKAIPKDKDIVEFAYRKIWIDKKTYLPLKVEHYNLRDEVYKIYEALEIKEIQATATITKAKMSDLKNSGYTYIEFNEVKYNLGIPADIFTERYLRRPARKWIK